MRGVGVFLNTRIEEWRPEHQIQDPGFLAKAADFCLAPVRYMCNGHTVRIDQVLLRRNRHGEEERIRPSVDHVASFHANGLENVSRTNRELHSSETGVLKTILAIVLFAPGLFFGAILKTSLYLTSARAREQHELAKHHYTPLPQLVIGSPEDPVLDVLNLQARLLSAYQRRPLHQPIDAIIIYGQDLEINDDPGLLRFNPRKVILVGARVAEIFRRAGELSLHDHMPREKWRRVEHNVPDRSFIPRALPRILEDALPRRGLFTCKRMRGLYTIGTWPRDGAPAREAVVV